MPDEVKDIHESFDYIRDNVCTLQGKTIHRSMWLFMTAATVCEDDKIQLFFQHVNWNNLNGNVAYEIANNISNDPMMSADTQHVPELGRGLDLLFYKHPKVNALLLYNINGCFFWK